MGNVISLRDQFATKFGVDKQELDNTLKQTAFKQSGGAPVSNEQMTALMIVANEYDLNPFTKEIYAYPDKGGIVPVVSVDGWSRIMNSHPAMDGIEFEYSNETVDHKGRTCHVWIDCIIYRKDRTRPIRIREYFEEVVRNTKYASPWDTHPNRMHRHKAEIQCARVAFGFSGIYDQDEAERIIEVDVTPKTQDSGSNQSEPVTIEAEDVLYPESDFQENFPKWAKVIAAGKKTPEQIIDMVQSKGALTEAQINDIKGVQHEAA